MECYYNFLYIEVSHGVRLIGIDVCSSVDWTFFTAALLGKSLVFVGTVAATFIFEPKVRSESAERNWHFLF